MRAVMIEVGHWHAKIHARSFQLGGAEIVAVSDHQAGVAERFAVALGGQVDAYADYREMLKAVQPEFVVALGRHVDMPDIARELLMAGIPFAIEKPAGLSADQVAPLREDAARFSQAFADASREALAAVDETFPAGDASQIVGTRNEHGPLEGVEALSINVDVRTTPSFEASVPSRSSRNARTAFSAPRSLPNMLATWSTIEAISSTNVDAIMMM